MDILISDIVVLFAILTCVTSKPFVNQSEKLIPRIETSINHDAPVNPIEEKDVLYQQVAFLFNSTEPEPIKPKLLNHNRPSCAKSSKQTFCNIEEVPDYPRNQINSLVNYDKDQFNDLFGLGASVGVEVTLRTSGNRVMEVTDAEDTSETNICEKSSNIFYPVTARNRKKDWVYVVNDEEYVQAVTAETCRNEETPCEYLKDSLPLDFTSICRQKYSYKRLLAVDPEKGSTYTDEFPIPSCCSCYLKSSTLGFSLTNSRKSTTSPKR